MYIQREFREIRDCKFNRCVLKHGRAKKCKTFSLHAYHITIHCNKKCRPFHPKKVEKFRTLYQLIDNMNESSLSISTRLIWWWLLHNGKATIISFEWSRNNCSTCLTEAWQEAVFVWFKSTCKEYGSTVYCDTSKISWFFFSSYNQTLDIEHTFNLMCWWGYRMHLACGTAVI